MDLNEADQSLLSQSPADWAPLGPIARLVDHVQHLRDMGLVKTRMVPMESKPGHAVMEWQITVKGRQALTMTS